MRAVIHTLLILSVILFSSANSFAASEQECRHYFSEMVELTNSNSGILSEIISGQETLEGALRKNRTSITRIIGSWEKVAKSSREPEFVKLSLNFANMVEKESILHEALTASTKRLLQNVRESITNHVQILEMMADEVCIT